LVAVGSSGDREFGGHGREGRRGLGGAAAERKDPQVWAALEALVDPVTRVIRCRHFGGR
jgi:hypothetical protein